MRRVLLFGGFSGWFNLGDLFQLRSFLNFYQDRGFEPFIILYKASLQSPFHLELLKEAFGENLIFYEKDKFYDSTLREIPKFSFDIFHLYGGGFFNKFWGKTKLETIEKVLSFFNPQRYFITGQQVSQEFLPYLKRHLEVFKPDIFAVRDEVSFEICQKEGLPVEFSFDDATEYLLEVRKKLGFETSYFGNSSEKKILFLHLNLSYYVLKEEGEEFFYRERLRSLLSQVDEVILVKSFQSYSLEVKDTFRALDYLFATYEKPFGGFIDLSAFALKENWEDLKAFLSRISLHRAICISNSYHTALFFTFLSIPSILVKLNPYYSQKGSGIWDRSVNLYQISDKIYDSLKEIREEQQKKLLYFIEKRKEFVEKFLILLKEKRNEGKRFFLNIFTYEDVPDFDIKKVECEPVIKDLRETLDRYKENTKKLQEELQEAKENTKKLQEELQITKAELQKIYNSRGWKVLTIYYKIKYWILKNLGFIK
jgi:FtsZ-binding cell division protein ZapB